MYKGVIFGLGMVAVLAGCGNREEILQGPRLELRSGTQSADAEDTALVPKGRVEALALSPIGAPQPLDLPAPRVNASWTHAQGSAEHRTVHPALASSPNRVWSANVGQGDSRRNRISASPVVADGRVFTLDAEATVQATSTSGATLWRRDLTPASERGGGASGGGLAIGGGTLFVTTGYGVLTALNADTGTIAWEQKLDAPSTTAPTVRDNLVYVVTNDSVAWAIDVNTGRIKWQLPGVPGTATMLGGAGPAVTDRLAIFAFGAEDVVASFRKGGVRRWDSTVSGTRDGFVYTSISDVTGAPVVDGNRIYVGNQSGRTLALNLDTGARIWTAPHGSYGEVWPEGGAVFLISDQAELLRLNAEDGSEVWRTPLPYFKNDRPRRRKAVFAHYGPVMAGGRLWVGSSDDTLRAFDPISGALVDTKSVPGGAASAPIVVDNTLYILSGRGQLHAFR